jgi:hypothetical protein
VSQPPVDDPSVSQPPVDDPSVSQPPSSGLRNPAVAVRGVAAGTLVLEVIVMLLALAPINTLGGGLSAVRIGIVAGLAAGCVVVAAALRRFWAWQLGTALQVAIAATGFFQWALFVLGTVFLLIWLYVLKLRRDLGRPAAFDH